MTIPLARLHDVPVKHAGVGYPAPLPTPRLANVENVSLRQAFWRQDA
jgi:hypothetical protein